MLERFVKLIMRKLKQRVSLKDIREAMFCRASDKLIFDSIACNDTVEYA